MKQKMTIVRRDTRGDARSYRMDDVEERKAPLMPSTSADVIMVESPAFVSHDGASERTSGMDRAKSQIVRTIPISIILLILTIGMAWKFEIEASWVLVTWGIACAGVYFLFDRQERDYSTNGLERFRIDRAYHLRRDELHHDHELKRMALESHLRLTQAYYKQLEVDDDER